MRDDRAGARPGRDADVTVAGRRWAAMMFAVLLGVALLLPAAPGASASQGRPGVASAVTVGSVTATAPSCVSPLGKYGGTLSFQLASVDPLVATAAGSRSLRITGSYTNTSKLTISDLGYKFQRGDPLTSAAQIRQQAAHPCQQVTVINSGFTDLHGTLKARATAPFTATVPITGDPAKSLAIATPGVYPIMININATVALPEGPARARVGELHLMLTVLSVPGSSNSPPLPGDPTAPGIPFNILWPIVDRPHLGVNGVFTDDELASEIGPGGRLTELVDALAASRASPQAITLVIDPMLLDELDRMSHGYWVVAKPGTPQPTLTPTLNKSVPTGTTTSSVPPTTAGSSGQADTGRSQSQHAPSQPGDSAAVTPSSLAATPSSTHAPSSAPQSSPLPTTGEGSAGASTGTGSGTGAAGESTGNPPATAASAGGSTGSTAPATPPATPSATPAPTAGSTSARTPESTAGSTPGSAPATTPQTSQGLSPGPRPSGTVAGTGKAAAAAFLQQLRALALNYHVLVLPYADPDSVALVRADMAGNLATAVYRGRAVASRVLGQPVGNLGEPTNLITDIADPYGGVVDSATLAAYQNLGYRSVVLSSESIGGAASPLGAVPLSFDGRRIPALVSGASLTSDIGSYVYTGVPSDAATQVNLLAALLVTEHSDQTTASAGTPMILTPGRDWAPNSAGIRYITSLLAQMSANGIVAGTTLPEIVKDVSPEQQARSVSYPHDAQATELPPGYLAALQSIDNRISVLNNALSASPGPEGADPAQILDPLNETLLTAVSASWRGSTDPDGPVLDTVNDTLDSLYAGVTIHRSSDSYTLASSNSPLLLTVQNTLPYQVTVGVSILGGNRVGLVTNDPARVDIPGGPRTKQIKIDAQVSRSGTFTVFAQLRGPLGAPWGGTVPLIIASRAYGVLTLVLMLVAGGVLVLMSVFRVHQRWRTSRARRAGKVAT